MKKLVAEYKVPKGKLVRVHLGINDNKIQNIKLTGDFFLHPEESIELIEKKLISKELDRKILTEAIDNVILEEKIECIGVNTLGFVEVIFRAFEESINVEKNNEQ